MLEGRLALKTALSIRPAQWLADVNFGNFPTAACSQPEPHARLVLAAAKPVGYALGPLPGSTSKPAGVG